MQLFVFVCAASDDPGRCDRRDHALAPGARRAQPRPDAVRRCRDVRRRRRPSSSRQFRSSCTPGAIVVLFLFVIMLLGVDKAEDLQVEPFKLQRKVAALVGGGVIGLIAFAAISSRDNIGTQSPKVAVDTSADHDSNIRALARDLFSDHVLAFELTSVLLVIAVVGTVLLARRAPKCDRRTRRHERRSPHPPRRGISSWPPFCSASAPSVCWSVATR